MGLLKSKDRELLATEVFLKTGVAISAEDPIFALVEILKSNQVSQEASFEALCETATQALKTTADDLAMRGDALKGLIDSYVEHRLEAANLRLDLETQQLKASLHDSLKGDQQALKQMISLELSRLQETIRSTATPTTNDEHARSWMDSLWTLTACLAIGFVAGFIYFNGTMRGPLIAQLELLSTKIPATAVSTKR